MDATSRQAIILTVELVIIFAVLYYLSTLVPLIIGE